MTNESVKQDRAIKALSVLGKQLLDDFEAHDTHDTHYSVSVCESGKGLEHVIASVMLLEKNEEASEDDV